MKFTRFTDYMDYNTERIHDTIIRLDKEKTVTKKMSLTESVSNIIAAALIVASRKDEKFANEKSIDFILDNSNDNLILKLDDAFYFYDMVLYKSNLL